jgi:hypothetical protein
VAGSYWRAAARCKAQRAKIREMPEKNPVLAGFRPTLPQAVFTSKPSL